MAGRPARTAAVVAILGTDSFRAESALARVLADAGLPPGGETAQVVRGDEISWVRLVDAASTGSLFAERRAVIVRGADLLKGDGEEMIAYLANPSPDVLLVLLAAKGDKRKTLWKRVSEEATVVDAEPLKGRALQSHVAEEVRRRKLRLTEDALVEVLDRVGQDLRRLMGELDKLEAFAATAGGERIDADAVAQVLGRGLAKPLYKLSDAMMARRQAEVLTLLEERLDEGEPAPVLLVTLHRAVRQTRAARALAAARAPRDQIVARLRIPPFKVGDVLEAAQRWSEEELRSAIQALARADQRLKTGGDPRVALTEAVAVACRAARAPRPRAGAR